MERLRHITGPPHLPEAALLLAVGISWAAYPSLIKLYREPAAVAPGRHFPAGFVRPVKRFAPSFVHISSLYAPVASDSHEGLGSGFIIIRAGHILINYHLVAHAGEIVVKLAHGRELDASVVGRDGRSDIALIKVAAPDRLKPAALGDSSLLEAGDWVVAMGSPFGFEKTLTAGIVSAKARRLAANAYLDYIQTDVTINPGNSGGLLLDHQRRAVGMSTAILGQNGGSIGIHFAVPINLVKHLLPQLLLSEGRVARGWLGTSMQTMTPAMAKSLCMEKPGGALVVGVAQGGPAAEAGLQPVDVVIGYDGKAVIDAAHCPALSPKRRSAIKSRCICRHRIMSQVVVSIRELKNRNSSSRARRCPVYA
jgi:serine protease Do